MARHRRSKHVFGTAPVLYHSRSQFDLSHSHKTAFSAGSLIPILVQEVLPGDTFKVDMSAVFRTPSPFLRPVMDNAFLDVFFFYVPNRLVFDDWERIFGSESPDGWTQPEAVSVPQILGYGNDSDIDVYEWTGTLADYMGLPLEYLANLDFSGNPNDIVPVSVLPFRAYAKIYNDWFRDENLIDPVLIQTGGSTSVENVNHLPFSASNYTGLPAKISKTHDYFTQLLPSPQKGSPVTIPLAGNAPLVLSGSSYNEGYTSVVTGPQMPLSNVTTPLNIRYINSVPSGTVPLLFGTGRPASTETSAPVQVAPSGDTGLTLNSQARIAPSNLWSELPSGYADMSSVTASNINDLRYAFQLQKMLERDARVGGRYREYLLGAFGVSSPDSRLQVSEYLAGARLPMSIFQVNQTSGETSASDSGNQNTPLGTVGAYSMSNGRCRFSKSFVEHGFIIGLAAVRQHHTYQQGVERFWTRKDRTDYYDPIFMNIGEQPVYTSELYATAPQGQIMGYNPAWEDYRYRPNRVSGAMRTAAGVNSQDIWHFADYYSSAPVLGQQWIQETPDFIDRTLSVPSTSAPQFIADFYFKTQAVRVMPTYSVPGLIDHH